MFRRPTPTSPPRPLPKGLTEWEAFCIRHQKRGNLWMHFVSSLCFWGAPVVALVRGNPAWLIAFFASGPLGTLGHHLFDDGEVSVREATVQPRVPFFVAWMFLRILRGQYAQDVAHAEARAQALRDAEA